MNHVEIRSRARSVASSNRDLDPYVVLAATAALAQDGHKLTDSRIVDEARRRSQARQAWLKVQAAAAPRLGLVARSYLDFMEPLRYVDGLLQLRAMSSSPRVMLLKRYARVIVDAANAAGVKRVAIDGTEVTA